MQTAEDDPSGTQSELGPNYPVSRRSVLIGGGTLAGMLSIGIGSASADGSDEESKGPDRRCSVTVTVTGLEVEGPMSDVSVYLDDEKRLTDESGTATFEVRTGTYELRVEKDRWETVRKTLHVDGKDREMKVPMHIDWYNDLRVTVLDARYGRPIKRAEVSLTGYGTERTDGDGTAMLMVERMMEPTDHELTVSADGYRTETRQLTIGDDKRLTIELLPK